MTSPFEQPSLFPATELGKTLAAVREVITGKWLAPHEIWEALKRSGIHISAEATTARIRDLSKPQFGAHRVLKRRTKTYFEYSIQ
jgi:hypothetical protein